MLMRVEATAIPPEFDRYFNESDLLEACHDNPLAGYPKPQDRWHVSADKWDEMAATGVITIPEGPNGRWAVWSHPARDEAIAAGIIVDPANPDEIDPARKAAWRNEYALVTDRGLPVHPLTRLGVTTEILDGKTGELHKLGMATGIGRERRYGALNTGALLLARLGLDDELEYPVVTEWRNKRLRRSFPGGYVELGEEIADACVREGAEESKVIEACGAVGIQWADIETLPHVLWKLSPSVTGPCTVNTWLAEHFLAIDATGISDMKAVALSTDEDAIEAVEWLPAHELVVDPTLQGAHRRALKAHMAALALK